MKAPCDAITTQHGGAIATGCHPDLASRQGVIAPCNDTKARADDIATHDPVRLKGDDITEMTSDGSSETV